MIQIKLYTMRCIKNKYVKEISDFFLTFLFAMVLDYTARIITRLFLIFVSELKSIIKFRYF